MDTQEKESKMENTGERLWSKYWASQGVKVVHVDMLRIREGESLDDRVMRIVEVIREKKNKPDDHRHIVKGIICRWFTEGMETKEATFHSCELIPYDIAKLGHDVVSKWINRTSERQDSMVK
jgi:hypothetical protein